MALRGRRGFTLIELLVVIVIVLLLMALILPAIIAAICTAREGATRVTLNDLTTACKNYEIEWATYPPGNGSGSIELASYLSREGPKKLPYFQFHDDMLTGDMHIMNPVWPVEKSQTAGPESKIYYRNNVAAGAPPPGGGGAGNQPQVYNRKSVDIWCAGCNYESGQTQSMWSVNNWE